MKTQVLFYRPCLSIQSKVHRGFTLIEMMVAMALASILIVLISNATGPGITFFARLETDSRLKDLRVALTAAYNDNATKVDATSAAVFTTALGTVTPLVPSVNNLCVGSPTMFNAIARYLNTSASDAWHDGFGRSFCVYITPIQNISVNSITFNYHSIAIVSAGVDGAIDSNTALSGLGILTLGGDDKGVLIDGRSLMQDKVSQSLAIVNRSADAYQTYFNTRYLANTTRDISVDYFANTDRGGNPSNSWDFGGAMPNTGGNAVNMVNIGAHTVLGLTLSDVTDAFGQILMIDNSSDAVRNPQNSTGALQTPGFTARISTVLPGGQQLSRTVIGSY
jgi:prepilin-type N-terminal cleavage/methylation domain-containing protein